MIARLAVIAATLPLLSCSSGEDEPLQAIDAGSVTDYAAICRLETNRSAGMSVFEGGLIYVFYQSDIGGPKYPAYGYAGFFRGVTTDTGRVRRYGGVDFDFDASVAHSSSLTLTFDPSAMAVGPLVHLDSSNASGNQVYGVYSTVSTNPTAAAPSGSYVGYARSVGKSIPGLIATVDARGGVSITGEGCTMTGQLSARPLANAYDAAIRLAGACPETAGDYAGHAFQSALTGNLYLMLSDPSGRRGVFMHLYAPA